MTHSFYDYVQHKQHYVICTNSRRQFITSSSNGMVLSDDPTNIMYFDGKYAAEKIAETLDKVYPDTFLYAVPVFDLCAPQCDYYAVPELTLITNVSELFIRFMNERLTEPEMAQVRKEIADGGHTDTCPTHDYCDANMVMYDAMRYFFTYDQMQTEFGTLIWNAAWRRAKVNQFRPKEAE